MLYISKSRNEEKNNNLEKIEKERKMINEEIYKGNLKKAEEMVLNSPYLNDKEFFFLYPKILLEQKRVEELIQICTNSKYENDLHVQGEYLKYLYLKEDYVTIFSIYERLKEQGDPKIFAYYVRAISKTIGINEALECIDMSCLKEDKQVITLKIHLLRKNNQLEKALKLCEESPNREELKILLEEVYILSKLHRYEEAYQKIMHSEYKEYTIIKTQLISILCHWYIFDGEKNPILLEKAETYLDEEAIKIDEKHFYAYLFFLSTSKRDKERKEAIDYYSFKDKKKFYSKKPNILGMERCVLAQQLGFIYQGTFDVDKLGSLKIEPFEKDVLLLAYLHRNSKKEAQRIVKQKRIEYKEDKEKLKVFNQIQATLEKKQSYFDITLYSRLLHTEIIFNDISSFSEKETEKKYFKKGI